MKIKEKSKKKKKNLTRAYIGRFWPWFGKGAWTIYALWMLWRNLPKITYFEAEIHKYHHIYCHFKIYKGFGSYISLNNSIKNFRS